MKLTGTILVLIASNFASSSAFAAETAIGQVKVYNYPQPSSRISVQIKGAAAKLLFDTFMLSSEVAVTIDTHCQVTYVEGQGIRCFKSNNNSAYECGISLSTSDGTADPTGGISCL